MQSMRFLSAVAAVGLVVSCAANASNQGDSMVLPVNTLGSRAFLVRGTSGFILFDCGMEKEGRAVIQALADQGASVADLRLIVLSHAHPDHYGGAARLRLASGAPVAAQGQEAGFIQTGRSSPTVPRSSFGNLLKLLPEFKSEACPVDMVIDRELDLAEFGVEGKVMLTPGHTAGSLSVVLADGAALVGDVIRGRPGKVELGPFYTDGPALATSLHAILAAGARRLYFSHGSEIDAAELLEFLGGKS